ncbi:NADP-dependent oxidoreductase [Geobacter argillaceus]|uniref:NADPH:quinone reductase-like Zn-dependent oxidoreductase n=1 Tax=Geobacter argillaceus TaxID=345631 RepID=A0A562VFI5_9BACT|nr:NADP-dependent oxidoreductase [Geobacter argillaceus]TWJ16564.1 NADPH:quinone reductase-like Zn-dependent oxidoreductase [Geobacter argillaceus]
MQIMKAVRIHTYGGPEVLVHEEVPLPRPQNDEVLVRVRATAVNPVDWKIREGYLREMLPHSLPLIMGWDVSGVVEETGPGVTRFNAGDEVFSRPDLLRDGTYSEYVVIRETEVAFKPESIDHIHAAAIPLAGITAWKSLIEAAGLSAGQRVLIHGAAGGVGSYAVQLAKWQGAHVIATASEHNHDYLHGLGADEMIDYRSMPFEDTIRDVDAVFDTIGGDTQERSWQVLKKGGILVSIVAPPPEAMAAAHGCRQAFVFIQPDAAVLAKLAQLVDGGKL